jgi:UDP-2-acetamido-3-amino-2,3-dideoxy-glucuronate N-acetyltransferase
MSTNPVVGVIGCGYWGKNLVRNFYELGALGTVCDLNDSARSAMESTYGVHGTPDVHDILNSKDISGVVIAASASQHYSLTKAALLHGKDVFVEKPLALRVSEGQELVELAKSLGRILMVGHLLEYHPAVQKLKSLIRSGALGKIRYIYSSRLNIGKLRTEENILWSFAPHDIAAILSLLNEFPEVVSAQGGAYLSTSVADTTLTTCRFPSGVMAHIFVSWLHPFKEQKLCVIGDRNMAVFDDLSQENKLVLYPHTVEWIDRTPVAKKNGGIPVEVSVCEPLKEECQHFLDCIRDRRSPLTNGESALRVLQVLGAAEESLHNQGRSVTINTRPETYTAHPTAVIDEGCTIGNGTRIWHFSHVMSNSQLGERCNLGQNVVISSGCRIGSNVKIQNNVSVYTGVELEDDVFCGPSMVFTNVINPRSHIPRRDEFRKTLVKRGASLGANSTVVCGITIGEYAFIGAGAVVTHDVPPYALVIGVPARLAGWVCKCGVRLPAGEEVNCAACGTSYLVEDEFCQPALLTLADAD